MTREEILRDYEEVEQGDKNGFGCKDCHIKGRMCELLALPCKSDTIFKRKKEKVMSKCNIIFRGPEVTKKVKDIPDDTYFSATVSDGSNALYLKTDTHLVNLSCPCVTGWSEQCEVSNYKQVDVVIDAVECKS